MRPALPQRNENQTATVLSITQSFKLHQMTSMMASLINKRAKESGLNASVCPGKFKWNVIKASKHFRRLTGHKYQRSSYVTLLVLGKRALAFNSFIKRKLTCKSMKN